MAMVNDIKRTEAFAPTFKAKQRFGRIRQMEVLLVDPLDSLSKRKNNRHRNWALFCASITSTMALLIILPFSADLLSPTEVVVSEDYISLTPSSSTNSFQDIIFNSI